MYNGVFLHNRFYNKVCYITMVAQEIINNNKPVVFID